MILPMCVAAPVLRRESRSVGFGCVWFVGWAAAGVAGAPSAARGDGHEGRSQHAVAQPVAAPDLGHDLAVGAPGAGHAGHGLVLAGVERSGRAPRSACTPSLSSSARSLRSIAAMPSIQGLAVSSSGTASIARSKSSAIAEHLAQQVLAREAHLALALLGRPAPVVLELGARRAAASRGAPSPAAERPGARRSAARSRRLRARRAPAARSGSRAPRRRRVAARSAPFAGAVGGGVGRSFGWSSLGDAGRSGVGVDRTSWLRLDQAYRCSTSSFIRPETKPTVPIACGYDMRVGPSTPTTPIAWPGRPYGARTSAPRACRPRRSPRR